MKEVVVMVNLWLEELFEQGELFKQYQERGEGDRGPERQLQLGISNLLFRIPKNWGWRSRGVKIIISKLVLQNKEKWR